MSVQGRPPRASARRPPGEDKALAGSAAPTSGALAVAARQLDMSEQKIFDLAVGRWGWGRMVVVGVGVCEGGLGRCKIGMGGVNKMGVLGEGVGERERERASVCVCASGGARTCVCVCVQTQTDRQTDRHAHTHICTRWRRMEQHLAMMT